MTTFTIGQIVRDTRSGHIGEIQQLWTDDGTDLAYFEDHVRPTAVGWKPLSQLTPVDGHLVWCDTHPQDVHLATPACQHPYYVGINAPVTR